MKTLTAMSFLTVATLTLFLNQSARAANTNDVKVCTLESEDYKGTCYVDLYVNKEQVKLYDCCDPAQPGTTACTKDDRNYDQAVALANADGAKLQTGGVCVFIGFDRE